MKKLALLLLLAGCSDGQRVQDVELTSNPDFNVVLLFEKDGYRVYRFEDGRSRYFVVPEGQAIWDHREGAPKTRYTVDESSDTVRERK